MFFILCILSTIPRIDKYITRKIYEIKYLHSFSYEFSSYIVYINIILRLYSFIFQNRYLSIVYTYVDVCFINLLKWIFDRERPKYFFIKDNIYQPLYEMNVLTHFGGVQSFPSGHVATIYLTWCLYDYNYIIGLLLIITIFARINIGQHYFSDTLYAILISQIANRYK